MITIRVNGLKTRVQVGELDIVATYKDDTLMEYEGMFREGSEYEDLEWTDVNEYDGDFQSLRAFDGALLAKFLVDDKDENVPEIVSDGYMVGGKVFVTETGEVRDATEKDKSQGIKTMFPLRGKIMSGLLGTKFNGDELKDVKIKISLEDE